MDAHFGELSPPPPPPSGKGVRVSKRRRSLGFAALFFGTGGVLLAILPIVSAWLGSASAGGSMWDESGSGAVLWMLLFTIPLGGASMFGGFVCWLRWRTLPTNSPALADREQGFRR